MKKFAVSVLALFCAVSVAACTGKAVTQDTTPTNKNTENIGLEEEKALSEQEVKDMFNNLNSADDFTYLGCVLIPDKASDRVGAVLFEDETKETTNVAFFDADGYAQQCGTYAKAADDPEFTYLGDGTVTFKLKTEDNIIYNYTLTISIDGMNVNFTAKDDLQK